MTIYYLGLAGAYRTGEMSLAYPLARALPVLFVPVASLFIGSTKGLMVHSLLGMFVAFIGCMVLPQANIRGFSFKRYFKAYSLFAVIAALGTTAYTLIDSSAMRILGNTATDPIPSAIFFSHFK